MFKQFNVSVIYQGPTALSCIKNYKDPLELDVHFVVYSIPCLDCDTLYIGETKRVLKTEVTEQEANIKLSEENQSIITKHINFNKHNFDWSKTKILDVEHLRLFLSFPYVTIRRMAGRIQPPLSIPSYAIKGWSSCNLSLKKI